MSSLKETKKLIKSKTIWGIIIMVAGFIGSKIGVSIQEADVKEILDMAFNILESGGALLALYGRVKATKKIGK